MADWKTELNPFLTGSKSRTDENEKTIPYIMRRDVSESNGTSVGVIQVVIGSLVKHFFSQMPHL